MWCPNSFVLKSQHNFYWYWKMCLSTSYVIVDVLKLNRGNSYWRVTVCWPFHLLFILAKIWVVIEAIHRGLLEERHKCKNCWTYWDSFCWKELKVSNGYVKIVSNCRVENIPCPHCTICCVYNNLRYNSLVADVVLYMKQYHMGWSVNMFIQ